MVVSLLVKFRDKAHNAPGREGQKLLEVKKESKD
jgi:hypothetical protein